MGAVRPIVKASLPRWVPDQVHKTRILGLRKYLRYVWLIRTEGRKLAAPEPYVPYDIGAPRPIILDETTLHTVRAHFIESGQGIRELLAFKRIAPGHSTFLDVGAAEGIFSATFCALTGKSAYAFEPSPEMFGRLTALSRLNPNLKVTSSNLALGASQRSQAVDVYSDAQFRGVDASNDAAAVMHVDTLDGFVEQHALTPDFAKIDVEGMELEVFRGGIETFSRSVDAMMLEVHPTMLIGGETVGDLEVLLRDIGYRLFTLDFKPIDNLAGYLDTEPELMGGATNIVCRK